MGSGPCGRGRHHGTAHGTADSWTASTSVEGSRQSSTDVSIWIAAICMSDWNHFQHYFVVYLWIQMVRHECNPCFEQHYQSGWVIWLPVYEMTAIKAFFQIKLYVQLQRLCRKHEQGTLGTYDQLYKSWWESQACMMIHIYFTESTMTQESQFCLHMKWCSAYRCIIHYLSLWWPSNVIFDQMWIAKVGSHCWVYLSYYARVIIILKLSSLILSAQNLKIKIMIVAIDRCSALSQLWKSLALNTVKSQHSRSYAAHLFWMMKL